MLILAFGFILERVKKDLGRKLYISIDILRNMVNGNKGMEINLNVVRRSPRLDTILMVEKFVKENSGEYTRTEIFNKLPKKVMWGTFNVIIDYLLNNNRIGIDRKSIVVYIWNPELAKKFINRKRY